MAVGFAAGILYCAWTSRRWMDGVNWKSRRHAGEGFAASAAYWDQLVLPLSSMCSAIVWLFKHAGPIQRTV